MGAFRFGSGETVEEISRSIRANFLNSARGGDGGGAISDVIAVLAKEIVDLRRELSVLASAVQTNEALQRLIGESSLPFSDAVIARESPPESFSTIASEVWDAARGFYFLEWSGTGEPYRWVGPRPHCDFQFPLDREQPRSLELAVLTRHGDFGFADIKCTVDGQAIPLTVTDREIGVVLSGVVPAKPGRKSASVKFSAPFVTRASGDDTRELSFGVSSLTVRPVSQDEGAA